MDPVATRIPPPTTENSIETKSNNMMKKLITRRCQLELLKTVRSEKLTHTDILPSLTPRLKLNYKYSDLDLKKDEKLKQIKKQLLILAIHEAERDVEKIKKYLNVTYAEMHRSSRTNCTSFKEFLEESSVKFSKLKQDCKKRHQKKIEFYRKKNNTQLNQKKENRND